MPQSDLTFAVPKGRLLDDALPVMERAGVVPEAGFHDKANRSLTFATTRDDMRLIRVPRRIAEDLDAIAFGIPKIDGKRHQVVDRVYVGHLGMSQGQGVNAAQVGQGVDAHGYLVE